jgi:hypothetical protein
MARPEYVRLHQLYEAALRRWGQVILSSQGTTGTPARLAALIRQKAVEERNAANERMRLHEFSCPLCSPRVLGVHL